jgi:hypothetical protein
MFSVLYTAAKLNGEMLVTAEKFGEILSITKELEGYGDTVSASDYQSLVDTMGSQMEDFFVQLEDGTYALVTSAEEFTDTIRELEKTKIANKLKAEVETLKNLKGYSESISAREDSVTTYTVDYKNDATKIGTISESLLQSFASGDFSGLNETAAK